MIGAPAKPVVLSVDGLGREFDGVRALRDLSFSLRGGECVALLGHNGSGKTTAIKLICGLLAPSSGSVRIGTDDFDDDTGEEAQLAAHALTALVPDTPALYDDLSVREHLQLVALAHGQVGDDLPSRIDEFLDRFGLLERADSVPRQLSRGTRQKVALACALIRPHALLVLDEPVVGLDPDAQLALQDLLREAKARGCAVLLSTHQVDFARGIADRAIVLADGEMKATGPYEQVVDEAPTALNGS